MQPGASFEQSVELTGPLSKIEYPQLCASCGAGAYERLDIYKSFVRPGVSDQRGYRVTAHARVPFCIVCISLHQAELRSPSALRRFGLLFKSSAMYAALAAGGAAIFFLPKLLSAVAGGDTSGIVVLGGVAGFFALIAVVSLYAAWKETRADARPPMTSITSAFDFDDDKFRTFGANRRTFRLRNPAFAAAFMEANRSRIYDPGSPEEQTVRQKRRVLGLVAIGVSVLYVIYAIFSDLAE